MADSIKNELQKLETVGRVSVRGERQVHTGFGFSAMKRDPEHDDQPTGDAQVAADASTPGFAADLDDAFTRLKARVAPE